MSKLRHSDHQPSAAPPGFCATDGNTNQRPSVTFLYPLTYWWEHEYWANIDTRTNNLLDYSCAPDHRATRRSTNNEQVKTGKPSSFYNVMSNICANITKVKSTKQVYLKKRFLAVFIKCIFCGIHKLIQGYYKFKSSIFTVNLKTWMTKL